MNKVVEIGATLITGLILLTFAALVIQDSAGTGAVLQSGASAGRTLFSTFLPNK